MAGIVVKPRARILHGHDWVFSSEVLKVFGKPADSDVISLKDGRDRLIGSAIYNSKSQITARRFSRQRQDLDLDFFKRRIAQAAEYRARRHVDSKLCRVVWSESDGLPGVIIDRYGDHFVLQTLTLAMDLRKHLIADATGKILAPETEFVRIQHAYPPSASSQARSSGRSSSTFYFESPAVASQPLRLLSTFAFCRRRSISSNLPSTFQSRVQLPRFGWDRRGILPRFRLRFQSASADRRESDE
jgi:hypothetical protein